MTKKIPVDSGKKSFHESNVDFCERIRDRMEKKDNSFNESMKRLQQNMQVFTPTISNTFKMMSQTLASIL